MRIFLILALFGSLAASRAQATLQHNGGLQLHEGAQVGLFGSFVNQAPFEQEAGLFGFYGNEEIQISGDFAPLLYDAEIFREAPVFLNQSLGVSNNLSFMEGDFQTNKAQPEYTVTLLQNAFTVGEGNTSKVDGYVTAVNQSFMIFPVGDAFQYRPLTLEGEVFPITKCAYFREDPNSPSSFPPFRTDLKPRTIEAISTSEFWRLEGSSTGQVTLSWNPDSDLEAIATSLAEVVLMGWSKSARRWEPLGTQSVAGDLLNGFAISDPVSPDDFEVLTFGSLAQPEEVLTLDNYYLSPNGDGINDVLIIGQLEDSPNNTLEIFDRNGIKVFQLENYRSEFSGVANVDGLILKKEAGLPEGVYYLIVRFPDLGLEQQGFLFLDR